MPKIGKLLETVKEETPGIGSGASLESRRNRLAELLDRIKELPPEWVGDVEEALLEKEREEGALKPEECEDYKQLMLAWRKAMKWRQAMDDVLSTMLAVAISTIQQGEQLFLQVIGDAGGGKTRFCDAMLVSKNCYPLEHLTGFHSGFKDDQGNDYSLLSRINHKTLITPEADVIISSPHFLEIMSQQRRIFDGTSGASYKNMAEDQRYTGLRTPWVMAGTPALLTLDQSRLGDRFLKVFIDPPDLSEKRDILKRVAFSALASVKRSVNSDVSTQLDDRLAEAYSLTGGYIDYLRSNVETLLSELVVDEDWLAEECGLLAEFTADMRARPDPDTRKDSIDTKEMPTRLTHQFVRLACCLGAVLNRGVDAEVIRRVRKVALDTSHGITLQIARYIASTGSDGAETMAICRTINKSDDKTRAFLRFMYNIDVVETFRPTAKGVSAKPKWRLTERFQDIYDRMFNG